MNNFSKNLKFLIKRYDTNQEQLALYVEKKQTSISNWINGISEPSVSDLLKIHQFFGISLDALIKEDLSKGKIVTDAHVDIFKRIGKVHGQVLGKVDTLSRLYFVTETGLDVQQNEGDPVANWAIMGQLKEIQEKLDRITLSVDTSKPK